MSLFKRIAESQGTMHTIRVRINALWGNLEAVEDAITKLRRVRETMGHVTTAVG